MGKQRRCGVNDFILHSRNHQVIPTAPAQQAATWAYDASGALPLGFTLETNAHANRSGDPKSEKMAVFLRFPSPKAVLAVLARPGTTFFHDRTFIAEPLGFCFATLPSLGALRFRSKEELQATFAIGVISPVRASGLCCAARVVNFEDGHLTAPLRSGCSLHI